MSLNAITAEQLKLTNKQYATDYPNWTTSLRDLPMFSFRQTDFARSPDVEVDHLYTGSVVVRRPAVKATACALEELLTYEAVENLIKKKKITPALAREWGAIMQYSKKEVPFNLIAFGLDGADKDPEEPPVPNSDRLVFLGLVLPTEESVAHFKLWYEDGGPKLNFERDLILPLLTYWEWYRAEHPNVRGIDFGRGSVSTGAAASLEVPHKRKFPEPKENEYEPYPLVDINEDAAVSSDEETETASPPGPKVIGHSPSGAKIYG